MPIGFLWCDIRVGFYFLYKCLHKEHFKNSVLIRKINLKSKGKIYVFIVTRSQYWSLFRQCQPYCKNSKNYLAVKWAQNKEALPMIIALWPQCDYAHHLFFCPKKSKYSQPEANGIVLSVSPANLSEQVKVYLTWLHFHSTEHFHFRPSLRQRERDLGG